MLVKFEFRAILTVLNCILLCEKSKKYILVFSKKSKYKVNLRGICAPSLKHINNIIQQNNVQYF